MRLGWRVSTIPGLLCVHAHPDDESLFTGGILARCKDSGLRTAVVTCTRREGDARVDELRNAFEILGAGEPRLLGYDDSGTGGDRWLCAAPFDQAVEKIVAHIREFRPVGVVTYDAFGTYGHPDHIRAHRLTLAAVAAAGFEQLYPSAGAPWNPSHLYMATLRRSAIARHWSTLFESTPPPPGPGVPGVPDAIADLTIDVRPWLSTKWDALQAHRTETERGSGAAHFARLTADQRAELLGEESFIHQNLRNDSAASHLLKDGPSPDSEGVARHHRDTSKGNLPAWTKAPSVT